MKILLFLLLQIRHFGRLQNVQEQFYGLSGAAKIVKIKKAMKAAGGVRKAAKGIIAAIKVSKKLGGKWWTKIKWSDFGSGLAGFGADLIGISDIRSNCSF